MARPAREAIMTTLLNTLVAAVQTNFTANMTNGSAVLTNPSTTDDLYLGVPVFGPGIPRGAFIQNLAPLTLSEVATANATAVALTNGFLTTGRRLKFPQDVSAQPALFLRDGDEELEYRNIVLQQQLIKVEIWIYNNQGQDPDFPPIIGLNNLLDAVQAAFAPDNVLTRKFTLGGLVEWCRLSGKVTKWPGDLDGQAVAVAEAEIIVP